jgi:hypothetical protein
VRAVSNERTDTSIPKKTMHKALRRITFALVALLTASPLAAQGINGTWITEFERTVRNENGVVSAGDKARAKMTLQQKGDSVTGTWEIVSDGSRPATPRQLRGTIAGNKVSLTSEFEATVNIDGARSTRKVTLLYDFTVNGDKLEGTATNKSAEMDIPPRPFSAWRETK